MRRARIGKEEKKSGEFARIPPLLFRYLSEYIDFNAVQANSPEFQLRKPDFFHLCVEGLWINTQGICSLAPVPLVIVQY